MSNERTRNRSVVFTAAEATATETSDGEPTVTVQGHFTEGCYSQTSTLHLSREAALDLINSLVRAL